MCLCATAKERVEQQQEWAAGEGSRSLSLARLFASPPQVARLLPSFSLVVSSPARLSACLFSSLDPRRWSVRLFVCSKILSIGKPRQRTSIRRFRLSARVLCVRVCVLSCLRRRVCVSVCACVGQILTTITTEVLNNDNDDDRERARERSTQRCARHTDTPIAEPTVVAGPTLPQPPSHQHHDQPHRPTTTPATKLTASENITNAC